MKRRTLLQGAAAGAAITAVGGCATSAAIPKQARVVVVGGGYGGATAARYVRLFSDHRVDVVLVEPEADFVSCPGSNLVLAGRAGLADLTISYDGLRRHGVTVVRDRVTAIDVGAKTVRLAGGEAIRYDKAVISPGADLRFEAVEGLAAARTEGRIVQAWKAGPETATLRRQLEAMPDGGTFAITVPEAPYRCPPGPYERACVVAAWLKANKPRSKVLVLDANPEVVSKPALFHKAWAELYPEMVEYRPLSKATGVDARTMTVRFEVAEDVRADVLNVLPPMQGGAILVSAGLIARGGRWANVDYRTFASTVAPDVHVVGDSVLPAAAMPKSAHMANAHAKVVAAAIVAGLAGEEPDRAPMLTNTCYSWVSDTEAIHIASVHAYVEADRTFVPVPGSGGLSAARSAAEAAYATGWAKNIRADSFG